MNIDIPAPVLNSQHLDDETPPSPPYRIRPSNDPHPAVTAGIAPRTRADISLVAEQKRRERQDKIDTKKRLVEEQKRILDQGLLELAKYEQDIDEVIEIESDMGDETGNLQVEVGGDSDAAMDLDFNDGNPVEDMVYQAPRTIADPISVSNTAVPPKATSKKAKTKREQRTEIHQQFEQQKKNVASSRQMKNTASVHKGGSQR
ncbi:hypothetical protein QCA50_020439 [Cerrena zonata]|uniref:Uncharacterized protein n=1 Tax=Cerrena zonata TaxID=2478898 RepID=A0AAW0FCM3_9APHY